MSMEKRQVFLIQCNGEKAVHKYHGYFHDRRYDDEMTKYLYYRNDTWSKEDRRDRDFGEVKTGDIIIQYRTSNVKNSPSQIKNIFNVKGIENIEEDKIYPHILRLEFNRVLNHGCDFSTIRWLVSDGTLSEKMKNCGKRGFSICKVQYKDYQTLIDLDK
jgi:hypothetical protein